MSEKRKIKLKLLKYRHLFFAIIIVIIVIIMDIIFENYSSRTIDKISKNIINISKILKEDDSQKYDEKDLDRLINNSLKIWKQKEKTLTCFIEHEEIEKINVKLNILKVEIKNHLWGDAKITISETQQLVEYLNGKYKISLQNLF